MIQVTTGDARVNIVHQLASSRVCAISVPMRRHTAVECLIASSQTSSITRFAPSGRQMHFISTFPYSAAALKGPDNLSIIAALCDFSSKSILRMQNTSHGSLGIH